MQINLFKRKRKYDKEENEFIEKEILLKYGIDYNNKLYDTKPYKKVYNNLKDKTFVLFIMGIDVGVIECKFPDKLSYNKPEFIFYPF